MLVIRSACIFTLKLLRKRASTFQDDIITIILAVIIYKRAVLICIYSHNCCFYNEDWLEKQQQQERCRLKAESPEAWSLFLSRHIVNFKVSGSVFPFRNNRRRKVLLPQVKQERVVCPAEQQFLETTTNPLLSNPTAGGRWPARLSLHLYRPVQHPLLH